MQTKRFGAQRRAVRVALTAAACAFVLVVPWSDISAQAGPAYSIDFHLISTSGKRVRNSCFMLNGTAGQAAPGYSSGGSYSIVAGFWPAAPLTGRDELFFDSFEGC